MLIQQCFDPVHIIARTPLMFFGVAVDIRIGRFPQYLSLRLILAS